MKDVSFHEVIITRDDQKIVSADAWIYDILGSDAVKPMNELIAVEDIEIYRNNIRNCDGNWYPSKLLCPDDMFYTYMRCQKDGDDLVRITLVNADDLLNAHSLLMKTINGFKAQLDLYEDVFFEYTPDNDRVYVYNTELALFETGEYTLDEFERILLERAQEDQKQAVKGFITQVRSKVGRSTTMIEGNLLNDDPAVTNTVLDEAFIFFDMETEGVVGHIQPRRHKGTVKTNVIKHDSLTGLVEKADIIKIARERIDDRRVEGTSLVIIDIDNFKSINDTYGHQFGDEVIKKVADIVSNEVGDSGISGRFGGDEFFVIIYIVKTEDELRSILKGIKTKVSATFPDKGVDKDNPISVSIGAAVFPDDADNYEDLFTIADHCVYLAKEKGRNRYIIYNRDKHGDLESIKLQHQTAKKINERDQSYGDVIVKMFDMALHDVDSTPEHYLHEFAEAFDLQNVMLFVGPPFRHLCSAGSDVIDDKAAIDVAISVLENDIREKYFALGDFTVVNRLEMLPPYAHDIKVFLEKRKVYSIIFMRFYDKDGKECVLIISSIGKRNQWNHAHFKYYRAFSDLLSLHSLSSE